ncbi:MAG: hypothetical protein AB1650_06540 [Candidatus Omnitrophota bacterium]
MMIGPGFFCELYGDIPCRQAGQPTGRRRDVFRQEGNGVDVEMTRRVISNGNESVLPTETSHRDGAREIAGRETSHRDVSTWG